eukprot:TRINITY_DN2034_c0_g1_i1.p1 TRINITY_DN2034_c0_g1~~TRINITY_DN2034_c0_g1_i1.p1  ORF type:complete len:640 (+),score=185.43 TRINITY_DN2034_c0_g1_i1:178-1920(+)
MSDSEGDGQWGDWDEAAEPTAPTLCLFCTDTFPQASTMLEHCAKSHSFDLKAVRSQHGLDFYQTIRMLNYIRTQRKADATLWSGANDSFVYTEHAQALSSDDYLQPALADDPLLFDFEGDDLSDDEATTAPAPSASDGALPAGPGEEMSLAEQLEASQAQVKALQAMLQETRRVMQAAMEQDDDGSSASEYYSSSSSDDDDDDDNDDDDDDDHGKGKGKAKGKKGGGKENDSGNDGDDKDKNTDEKNLDYYFESYSWSDIHATMIKDKVRTDTYRDAMIKNPALFKDKVVLDIGSGTGILSLFAAQAGAKKVIGIDRSRVVNQAGQIAKLNKLDHIVSFIKGTVETVELPVDKVDIIISEWMGYALLYESMLDTVLFARDKWLRPGGVVLPDRCRVLMSGVCEPDNFVAEEIDFWDDVYGFDMQPMKELTIRDLQHTVKEAEVYVLPAKRVMTNQCSLQTIDIMTTTAEALDFQANFNLTMNRDGRLHQLCIYFDIDFQLNCENPVSFNTSPEHTPTHWMQTHLRLPRTLEVSKGDVLSGIFSLSRNAENRRCLDFAVSGTLLRAKSDEVINVTQTYEFQ